MRLAFISLRAVTIVSSGEHTISLVAISWPTSRPLTSFPALREGTDDVALREHADDAAGCIADRHGADVVGG